MQVINDGETVRDRVQYWGEEYMGTLYFQISFSANLKLL